MKTSDLARKVKDLIKYPSLVYIAPLVLMSIYFRIRLAYSVYKLENGFPRTHDSYWYIDRANELIQNFKISPDFNGIFYIGYYGLLALILLIFKTEVVMVILQVIINALSVLLVYRISEMVFSRRVAVIASLIFVFSYEIKRWSVYILTDSIFISSLLLCIYFLLLFKESKLKKYLYLFTASMVYMVFLRPAGVITAAFIVIYLLLSVDYKNLLRYLPKRPILCGTAAVMTIFVSVFFIYKTINSSLGMSFYWHLRWLLHGSYSIGNIFDYPTPYNYKFNAVKDSNYLNNFVLSYFINNWYHILLLYIKRFIFFWGELWIWDYHFKNFQEVIQYLRKLAPILLMIVGMVCSIRGRMIDKALVLFVPIISVVLFCLIFFVDGAWRYRVPCLPYVEMFMAYGIDLGIVLVLRFVHRLGLDYYIRVAYEKVEPSIQKRIGWLYLIPSNEGKD